MELSLTFRLGMAAAERKSRITWTLERVGMTHRMRYDHCTRLFVCLQAEHWLAPNPLKTSSPFCATFFLSASSVGRSALDLVAMTPDNTVFGRISKVSLSWIVTSSEVLILREDDGIGTANPANLSVPVSTTKPNGSGIGLILAKQILG